MQAAAARSCSRLGRFVGPASPLRVLRATGSQMRANLSTSPICATGPTKRWSFWTGRDEGKETPVLPALPAQREGEEQPMVPAKDASVKQSSILMAGAGIPALALSGTSSH